MKDIIDTDTDPIDLLTEEGSNYNCNAKMFLKVFNIFLIYIFLKK
jgi:hypothetical protein